jgi:sister-chromatid-cohesion protein PDS5
MASAGTAQTLMDLIRRHSLYVVNQSSIPVLVKRIQRPDNEPRDAINARRVLVAIAKQCPAVVKIHVAEFSRALAEEANTALIEISLQALASLSAWDESCAPNDKCALFLRPVFIV